jgi:hypothetical protein
LLILHLVSILHHIFLYKFFVFLKIDTFSMTYGPRPDNAYSAHTFSALLVF